VSTLRLSGRNLHRCDEPRRRQQYLRSSFVSKGEVSTDTILFSVPVSRFARLEE